MSDGHHVIRHVKQNRYLSIDSRPEIPPSYLIFKENGYFKAKNGQRGVIDFSETAATPVIQSALNALPANGGNIFFKPAIYDIVTTITIPANVTVEGANRDATIFRASGGIASRVVDLAGYLSSIKIDVNNLNVTGLTGRSGGRASNIYVSRFLNINGGLALSSVSDFKISYSKIEGPATAGTNPSVYLKALLNVELSHCEISGGGHNGIFFADQTGVSTSDLVWITDNYIHNNKDDAMDINRSTRIHVERNKIIDNEFYVVTLEDDCEECIVKSNNGKGNGHGIWLDDSLYNLISENILRGNVVDEIVENATSNYNSFLGNILPGGTLTVVGANSTQAHNIV